MKNISFLSENFQFLEVKFPINLKRHVFVMIISFLSTEFVLKMVKVNGCSVDSQGCDCIL